MKNNIKKGFTLVELLAVIAIIALLVIISVPNVIKTVNKSHRGKMIIQENEILDSAKLYINDYCGSHAINKNECVSTYNSNNKDGFVCLNTLIEKEIIDDNIYYSDTKCNGIVQFEEGTGKTFLLCSENGKDYSNGYVTNGTFAYSDYEKCGISEVKVFPSDYTDSLVDTLDSSENGEFKVSTLVQSNNSSNNVFGKSMSRDLIESITFNKNVKVPSNAITSWDVSYNKDNSTVAYYLDEDNNGLYELYIGGYGKVYAPTNSSYLFSNYKQLKSIDLNAFSTKYTTNMSYMFYADISLKALDLSKFDTSKVTNMSNMFAYLINVDELDLSNFNTSNVTNMASMFNWSSIISINVSGFDTSKVTNMSSMFSNCRGGCSSSAAGSIPASRLVSLIGVEDFDTSNVTNMASMFSGLVKLTTLDVSKFDTSKVTTMSSMFADMNSVRELDVSNFKTDKVTSFSNMFSGDSSLITLDVSKFNTSNATNMSYMFEHTNNLESIDVSHFDTSKVTNMYRMFYINSKLKSLDLRNFNTSKVTNMAEMFYYDDALASLDLSSFDTSNVTNMSGMFAGLKSLLSIDLSNFNTSKVTDMNYMFPYDKFTVLDLSSFDTSNVTNLNESFYSMPNLEQLIVGDKFNTSKVTDFGLTFESCPKLVFDFNKIDTSSAKYMNRMLGGTSKNQDKLDLSTWNTSNVVDMMGMFSSINVKELRLDNFDFSNVIYTGKDKAYRNGSSTWEMFLKIDDNTKIYVKDAAAKAFVEQRLANAGKSNEVIALN